MSKRKTAIKAIGRLLDEIEEWEIDVTAGPMFSYRHSSKMIQVPDCTWIPNEAHRAEEMLFSLAHEYGHARLFMDEIVTDWIDTFYDGTNRLHLDVHDYLKTFDERAAWWVGSGYIPIHLRGKYYVLATECLQSYACTPSWNTCSGVAESVNIGDWKGRIRGNPPYPRT